MLPQRGKKEFPMQEEVRVGREEYCNSPTLMVESYALRMKW